MAEFLLMESEIREGHGTRVAGKLRKKGKVPAVLYGHKQATLSIALSKDQVALMIRQRAPVVDIKTSAGVEKAQIMELQWDHLGKEVLHVDFKRVSIDEKIETDVPIEIKGTAPGIAEGGLLDQPMHSLRVECLAIAVPKSIRVNIGELHVGNAIHVREVTLPENVRALDDPEAIVIHVTKLQEEEAGAEAAVAEPEVITARKKEEEGEGE